MKKRVVITGAGTVTSLGYGAQNFWNSIKEGKSGISKVERIDTTNMVTKVAAEVKDFKPEDYIDRKEAKRMDRFSQFAMAATKIAMDDFNINLNFYDNYRVGVMLGVGIGGIGTFESQHDILIAKGPTRISPLFVPMLISNLAVGNISIKYSAKGVNQCVVTACASSTNALGEAFRAIQWGYADLIIAGGTEAAITPSSFGGFCSMKAMTTTEDPSIACRPFDLNRDGFVMGEGSGILILEEYENAVKRGANIFAEVVGYASTNDAYHITAPAPDGEGAAMCMKLAIEDAGISPNEVGYINAHGTSTDLNDKNETIAIRTVFKEHAKQLAVSSTKSMTGHLLGAAGAIEAIITAYALKEGFLPPTINYRTPDPECDLDYVPNIGRKASISYALSNSFGFGGHNATIVLKKI